MFDRYTDKVEYISKSNEKDDYGYAKEESLEAYVRYVGGKEVQVQTNNGFRTEHRLLYQCPFEVKDGDEFIVDGKKLSVKQSERVPDILGRTIYWECELL